ncbi:MAG: hypothetical protein KAZ63_02700 [Vitreoscilla sp.]|jgi:hypothetical protein|nr:hypothetical protein [Vitreoscilla sp.]
MSPPGRPKGEFRSAQHEGTPMSENDTSASQGSPALRFFVLLLLTLAVLGFGLASLCGGIFTIAGAGDMAGVWAISIPALLIGAVLCWLSARKLRRVWRGD